MADLAMTDTQLRDAAENELRQTTVGWNKVKNYPPAKLARTHWGKGLAFLALISDANATHRSTGISFLKKTTRGYSPTATNWKAAFAEFDKITDALPPPPVPTTKPSVPTGLTATIENNAVRLRWSANPVSDTVDTYQVYIGLAGQEENLNLAIVGLTYLVTKDHLGAALVPGRQYGFRISAHNVVGYGNWGALVTVTIPTLPPDPNSIFPSTTRYPSQVA